MPGRPTLRSADHGDIVVTIISHHIDWGLRSFDLDYPCSWNILPVDLRSPSPGLNTFAITLFREAYLCQSGLAFFELLLHLSVTQWQCHQSELLSL